MNIPSPALPHTDRASLLRRARAGRWLALLVPLALFVVASRALAAPFYADPAGRFFVELPKGWQIAKVSPEAGVLASRSAMMSLRVVPEQDIDRVIADAVAQARREWTQVEEVSSEPATLAGRAGRSVLLGGLDPRGAQSLLRITAAPFDQGVLLVRSHTLRQQYGYARIALVGIEESILTERPEVPSVRPTTDREALEEAFKAGILPKAVYEARVRELGTAGEPDDSPVVTDAPVRRSRPSGHLGVAVRDIALAERDAIFTERGAVVGTVESGSPASTAGVHVGDVIVAIEDVTINDAEDFATTMARHAPGDVIRIRLFRGQDRIAMRVRVADAPR